MKVNNGPRQYLESLPTSELDEILYIELQNKNVDSNAVHMIMDVLKERDSDDLIEISASAETAWNKYRAHGVEQTRCHNPYKCLLRVVSIILVLALLMFALPQKAEAGNLWNRFIYLTDSVLEFFNPYGANDHRVEYVFKTDNPGLQKVYDAVVEIGVIEPVVPMWIPEGYEFKKCKSTFARSGNSVCASFEFDNREIIFLVSVSETDLVTEYQKDRTDVQLFENGGVKHMIVRNNERWSVVWVNGKAECMLTMDCQEESVYKMIQSIYTVEGE